MTINVGIVGLSAGGGWAATAHLPYLQQSDKYTITAVCNSSTDTSRKAIEKYGLDSADAFSDVTTMCTSQKVDLVVCAVAVFSHYELIKPAIEAGKDVYVEWPLCATTKEAEEIQQLAKKKGVRTIIGLQGCVSHVLTTLEDIIKSGKIGTPLVTHISGSAGTGETGTRLAERYQYFKDRDIEGVTGQVMLSIYIGHTLEPLIRLLGQPTEVSAQLKTTWPIVDVFSADNKLLASGVKKTADDYASLQGTLASGVKYAYNIRGGEAFDDGEGLVWDIIGDKGQIRLNGSSIMLNLGATDFKIRVKDYESNRIEVAKLHQHLDLPLAAQNVGRLYENFADGKTVPTFDDAVRLHQFLDAIFLSASKGGTQEFLSNN
ncbi:transcription regulator gal80 [Aspergillus pseudoviridinutans]|uniref:Transcription regulator gal80 n=1 Tax=Aspergillus pseudoviridinutans TaxID=1517512 RepID=A0A9P3BBD9_9EURO|nr:transcription regulator gal80 [Aspergillus pseudoviridinutans]GIJ84621.1 transcription regulator gal80 [Aspergillus pseudoviridinutans]